jgi:hypothetical protein
MALVVSHRHKGNAVKGPEKSAHPFPSLKLTAVQRKKGVRGRVGKKSAKIFTNDFTSLPVPHFSKFVM